MRKNTVLIYTVLLLAGDFLAILSSFVIAYILRVSIDPRPLIEQVPALTYLRLFLSLLPFWLIIFAFLGLYRQEVYTRRVKEMVLVFVGTFIGILYIIAYEFVSGETIIPARLIVVYAFILGFSLLVLVRNVLWQIRKLFFKRGIGVNRTMIIGSAETTKEIANLLHNTPTSGYYIAAIVGGESIIPKWFKGFHYTKIERALKDIAQHKIDTVIQTKLYDSSEINRKILDAARNNHVDYKYIPAESEFYAGKSSIELFHYFPVISVHPTPLLGWGRVVKRVFDLAMSFVFLVITSPLMLLTAVAIKITDSGPIFFKQKRLSRYGKKVYVYKFRTMKQEFSGKDPKNVFKQLGRDDLVKLLDNGEDSQIENDPRLTKIGSFLRRTSIDELPQFINVFKGDISLIGPRAITPEDMELYSKGAGALMLNVKTGITGLAQIAGRSDLSYEERARLNLYYVQNWTFWLDIKILLKTIPVVLLGKNSK
ncbi:sugar transferase [Candidatus Saccharibacteria bacterium CPR2]|nr:sugar transferase [Candidatus Saccharibacteria bacterium CPR2]